ncbi:MAG: response regulator [Candidatus Manganitrophus sp.]|nr:response regulator [Candidatus Manganitrophus sp.]
MSKRVLIVDDNQDAIHILSAVLKRGGYAVSVAKNGAEAVEMVRQEHPALILLDIMMPKMDGFEVCQEIKGSPETRNIPILMITARKDPESRKRGLEVGASEYLVKPIHPAEVLRKVQEYLGDDRSSPPSLKSIFLPFLLLREKITFELGAFAYCSAVDKKPTV